jgi:hypothetical protein
MRRAMALPACLVALMSACGASPAPSAQLDRAFEQAQVKVARGRAPDLVAAAERARRDAAVAEQAGDEQAARDHATRARLLLGAAVAESERLKVEEARIEVERQARALVAQARAAERGREELARETRRTLSAQVASEQASRAFAAAEEAERRRFGRSPGEVEARYREAAGILRDRARLVAAAAVALGAAPEADALREMRKAIDGSAKSRDAAGAVGEAARAHRLALKALGEARARRGGPTPAEVGSLVRTAMEMGLRVERSERGLRIAPPARRWEGLPTRRLVSLLTAHPHGPVVVEGLAASSGAAVERQATARARALASALERGGILAERIQVSTTRASADAPEVEVVLLAYDPDGPAEPPR